MHGSLFSTRGIIGSVYIMLSGVKSMMTCVSSNILFYGVSFVVHSSFGMVRIVIVSGFFCGKASLVYGFLYVFFVVWVGTSSIQPFMCKGHASRSKYGVLLEW